MIRFKWRCDVVHNVQVEAADADSPNMALIIIQIVLEISQLHSEQRQPDSHLTSRTNN